MLLEHVRCDLCGHEKYRVRYRKPDSWLWINQFEFPVVECSNCGLVYVNPRPTEQSMSVYYPDGYHDNRNSEEHRRRYRLQAEYLPPLKNEKVLDIGCARGDWLLFLKELYPDILLTGVDFYSTGVNSKEIAFFSKKLPDCGLEERSFDIITSWAVFEHLHGPGEYFAEVSRLLRAGGKFIFLVTNSESLYGRKAFAEDVPRHTYHFSEATLKQYATKFGMSMSQCFYDDRLFDGRGTGTFQYSLFFAAGGSWEGLYFGKVTRWQALALRIGEKLDRLVFRRHWEASRRRSGIIVVEFEKK